MAAMFPGTGIEEVAREVGARLDELTDQSINRAAHEVHVQRQARGTLGRFDHEGADGDIGHKVTVHDVQMDPVGSGALD